MSGSLVVGLDLDDTIFDSDLAFSLGASMMYGIPIPRRRGADYMLEHGFVQDDVYRVYHNVLANDHFLEYVLPEPGAVEMMRGLRLLGHDFCFPTARPYEQSFMAHPALKRHGIIASVRSANGSHDKASLMDGIDVHLDNSLLVLRHLRESHPELPGVHYSPHEESSWDLSVRSHDEFYELIRGGLFA